MDGIAKKTNVYDFIENELSENYSFARFQSDYLLAIKDKQALPLKILRQSDDTHQAILTRYGRDRRNENLAKLYFVEREAEDEKARNLQIVAQQILDTAYCFFFNSERIDEEDEDEDGKSDPNDDKICRQIMKRMEGRKRTQREIANETKSKFVTMTSYNFEQRLFTKKERVCCFMENMFEDLKRHSLDGNAVQNIDDKLMKSDEYETESFIDDLQLQSHSNIFNFVQTMFHEQKDRDLAIERMKANIHLLNNLTNTYSAGYRYFYWSFYRNNTDKINVIYQSDTYMETEGNDGYQLCDWYIPAKYADFKTEILNNTTSNFTIMQWQTTKTKAIEKYKAWKMSPQWKLICGFFQFDENGNDIYMRMYDTKAATKWERLYGIAEYAVITIAHLMALLFYCNYSKQQYEFTATFRRIYWNETDDSLKGRHAHFHWWARLLRECVECFCTKMQFVDERVFYHGISKQMLFDSTAFYGLCSFHALFCILLNCLVYGPMSTTVELSVACKFAGMGIVVYILRQICSSFMGLRILV